MYKITTPVGKSFQVPEVRVHDSGALLCLNEDRTKTLRIVAAGSWVDACWEEPAPVEDPLAVAPEYMKFVFQGKAWQYKQEWLKLNKITLIKNLRTKNYTGLSETKALVDYLEKMGIYMPPGGYPSLDKYGVPLSSYKHGVFSETEPTLYKHDVFDDGSDAF